MALPPYDVFDVSYPVAMFVFETIDKPEIFYHPLQGETALPSWISDRLIGSGEGDKRKLYAVVDAAKSVNLPELLEASGLPHTCLFDGQSAEELANVCPWLVELDAVNTFTRALLSYDAQYKDAWCLWGRGCAMFVLSTAPLKDIRKHFRKFLKLQRSDGSWLYFRFWEGSVLPYFLNALPADDQRRYQGLFCGIGTTQFDQLIFCEPGLEQAFIVSGPPMRGDENDVQPGRLVISDTDMQYFASAMQQGFLLKLQRDMHERHAAQDKMNAGEFKNFFGRAVERARALGLDTEKDIAACVSTSFTYGMTIWDKLEIKETLESEALQKSGMCMQAVLYDLSRNEVAQ